MNVDWKADIDDLIKQRRTLYEVRDILKRFKTCGTQQDDVSNYLNELRSRVDEETEDWIIEILDVVCSWCQPQYKVW